MKLFTPGKSLLISGLLLIGLIHDFGVSEVEGYARRRLKDKNWDNLAKKSAYESLKLRKVRSHEQTPEEILRSAKMDADIATSMGAASLSSASERKRRDQSEAHMHSKKAEGDAIAAAAESAAAEADSVAAAVEAAEADASNEQHGSGHGGGDEVPRDSSITFEENEDGDNMVVVDEDLREKEHTGGGHAHASSSSLSEFDVSSQGEHGNMEEHDFDATGISGKAINLGSVHGDVETPLNKLLTESSDLAKEIRRVFEVLARREDYLVKEMEDLKTALQNAIQVLHDANKETQERAHRQRRDYDQNPYKACVYINPPQKQGLETGNAAPPEALVQGPPEQNNVQQYPVTDIPRMDQAETARLAGGEDIDLSSVYWLKLPENDEDGILEKVHQVLSGVRSAGRDVLLIPVTKQFASNEDVAKGFLKSVRVNPASQQAATSNSKAKKLRKKLRVRIRKL